MRIAIVHDWLTCMRGGERVLEELCVLFPDATLFTLFYRPGSVSSRIESMPIHVSPLNNLANKAFDYRNLLPLMPWAVSRFDLGGFDLIISNSHAVAKGVRKPPTSSHLCHCLTPMRYIWGMASDYFHYRDPFGIRRAALGLMLYPLRAWDRATAQRVDHFVANSRNVQERIRRCYGRNADVVYSPVNTRFFTPMKDKKEEGFFLIVSALVTYKRIDLAVEAFNQIHRRLVVVGDGPDLKFLKSRARPNIQFKGYVSNEDLRTLYRACSAVIIPGKEDFGLVSLEAQACGRPVLAYGEGGSCESVQDGLTGILFPAQTVDELLRAIRRLESCKFDPDVLRANAEHFSTERFHLGMREMVMRTWNSHRQERR